MSAITTHVLDTARGRPAAGVPVALEVRTDPPGWKMLGRGTTDVDGRIKNLMPAGQAPEVGVFRLTFDTGTYFRLLGVDTFYPEVRVMFSIQDPAQHYHVPLLLSPFGYSTYRGS